VKQIRIISVAVLLAGILGLGIEASSSYVLYRHFARLDRGFYPAGSATLMLADAVQASLHGRHQQTDLSIDHGPLFRDDPLLGYAIYPGRFDITERNGGLSHRFRLTVDASGHRVTSTAPRAGARRIYVTGDSALFGWGLNDEQTLPWLLQSRFPQDDVVNLSVNSYSTVHAKLQLDGIRPAVTPDDILVLTYHPITNDFNVASATMIFYLKGGFESRLGDPGLLQKMILPYGALDGSQLAIRRFPVDCALRNDRVGSCDHPAVTAAEAGEVTIRVFDAIMAEHPGHFVVAFLSGEDTDPVVVHLRAKGAIIADLRIATRDPQATDEVTIDGHAGPLWHYIAAERLAAALHTAHLAD
jgi:hypothetical protein